MTNRILVALLVNELGDNEIGPSAFGYRTPEYYSWSSARQRIYNSRCHSYRYYGGRGLDMCPAWDSFHEFLRDMGVRPNGTTLGRIDNDRGYWPDNCRWETRAQQAANRRPVPKRPDSLKGKCRAAGMPYMVVYQRIRAGWTEADALAKPVAFYCTKDRIAHVQKISRDQQEYSKAIARAREA